MDYRKRIYKQYASVCKSCSETFDQGAARSYAAAFSRYLDDWLPVAKDASILDLACGSGRTLFMLKENGYTNTSGVDISVEQVALARQVTTAVTEGDVLEFLSYKRDKYDLIFAQKIVGFEQVVSREIAPYYHGVISGIRVFLWAVLRRFVMLYNMVEIGHEGSGIYTRDFPISAIKPNGKGEA